MWIILLKSYFCSFSAKPFYGSGFDFKKNPGSADQWILYHPFHSPQLGIESVRFYWTVNPRWKTETNYPQSNLIKTFNFRDDMHTELKNVWHLQLQFVEGFIGLYFPQGPHSHILMMGGGGGSEWFFGSEILAQSDFFWVYEMRRDFFGSRKKRGIFWVAKKD